MEGKLHQRIVFSGCVEWQLSNRIKTWDYTGPNRHEISLPVIAVIGFCTDQHFHSAYNS